MSEEQADIQEQEPQEEPRLAVQVANQPPGARRTQPRNASRSNQARTRLPFKPAYLVLLTALVCVVVMSVLLFQGASGLLAQVPTLFSPSDVQQTPPALTPQGTLDLRPAFPTPGGGQGGQQSSLPPAYVPATMAPYAPTMAASPTVTAEATGTAQSGQFSLQITAIPAQVDNYTTVQVSVSSTQPDVSIKLQVTYTVFPYNYTARGTADGSGQATINWRVRVVNTARTDQVLAQVVAVSQDQNGQQVTSQTVTVKVNSFGVGGG